MQLIKKYTFFILLVLPLSLWADDSQPQAVICHTQILVTTPQNVGFYLGPVTQDTFVGTTTTGKWLNTYAKCVNNQYINAVAWDGNGDKHTYRTTNKYNNINNFITLIYPNDFDGAPTSVDGSAFCQTHLFNNSQSLISIYVQNSDASNKITILKPYQNKIYTSPCFQNRYLVARITTKDQYGRWKNGQKYKSLTEYTDINDIPFVSFPDDFKEVVTWNWSGIAKDKKANNDDSSDDDDSD